MTYLHKPPFKTQGQRERVSPLLSLSYPSDLMLTTKLSIVTFTCSKRNSRCDGDGSVSLSRNKEIPFEVKKKRKEKKQNGVSLGLGSRHTSIYTVTLCAKAALDYKPSSNKSYTFSKLKLHISQNLMKAVAGK